MSGHQDPLGLVGTTIADKYLIREVAGEGGFSCVYRAEHLIWKQDVAIKCFTVLQHTKQELRDKLLEDFIQEGKLMSDLSSRSAAIVQARDIGKLDVGDNEWIPYMVLEWLDGTPLDILMNHERRQGMAPRTLAQALTLLEPVAAAVDIAHRRSVAHRDLKPANIMIMGDGRAPDVPVKVLDFGIAKVMADHEQLQEQLKLTGQQITAFTPNHGAPEQFSRNYGATGPWTDVYAMALIVLEVLRNGQQALAGSTFFELGVSSCNTEVRPTPRTLGLQVSDAEEAVFLKALAVWPQERYPSMGDFWRALYAEVFPGRETWRASARDTTDPRNAPASAVLTQAPSTRVSQASHASVDPSTSSLVQPPVAAQRSNGALIGGIAAVLLLGAGIGGFLMFRGGSDSGTTTPSATPATTATATATTSAPVAPKVEWEGPCPKGMKAVNGGTFEMGSNENTFPLWKPAHKVTLDTFCLAVTEVTVGDYQTCVDRGDCKPADTKPSFPAAANQSPEDHQKQLDSFAELCNAGKSDRKDHPINCVDWYRADAYCKSLEFRLPTEAEWEYAARGNDGRKFPWGDDAGGRYYMNAAGSEWRSWMEGKGLPSPGSLMYEEDDTFVGTAPVGKYPRGQTQSGQLDMVGNVWEWTSDWYALYKPEDAVNPKGPGAGDRKAIRGGGFNGEVALWVNPAARYHQLATASVHAIGFRCASNVKPAD